MASGLNGPRYTFEGSANQGRFLIVFILSHSEELMSKEQMITNTGVDMEKAEYLFIAGGGVNWYRWYSNQCGVYSKI